MGAADTRRWTPRPRRRPCDEDGDGYRALRCGGNDCDDSGIRDNPGAAERCDFVDNNCSGDNNEGIVCEFYALTGELDTGAAGLYLVDPFRAVYTRINDVPAGSFDFDTTSDGTLYSMTAEALFRYDDGNDRWVNVANIAGEATNANGLAIDSGDVAYVTAENNVFEVDLNDGTIREIGQMGSDAGVDFYSSGDCVVDKNDVLYVSSRYGGFDDERDCLVRVDTATGRGTFLGVLSHDRVYGLTSAWGFMFGLTSSGELLNIDPVEGTSTLIGNLDELRFFGAASPPVASAPSPLPGAHDEGPSSLSLSRSARGSALPCSALLCSAPCWAALGACGDTFTAPVDGAQGDTGSADVAAEVAADASGPAPRCATPTPWEPGGALFADRTQEWGLDGVQGARVSAEDLDGDGWVDLVVRRGGVRWDTYEGEEAVRHQWVLRNEGGRFTDITQDSGLWSPRGGDLNEGRPGEVVAFGDVDNDGDLDAYVGLATADVTATRGQTSELMRNAGGGVFSSRAAPTRSAGSARSTRPPAPRLWTSTATARSTSGSGSTTRSRTGDGLPARPSLPRRRGGGSRTPPRARARQRALGRCRAHQRGRPTRAPGRPPRAT